MSESEKKADRESVRVCIYCRCEIVQLPDTRWRSIHGKSVYCAASDHRKKFHEPLAEPAEPSGGPVEVDIIEQLLAACVGYPEAKILWPHRVLHNAVAEITRLRSLLKPTLAAVGAAFSAEPLEDSYNRDLPKPTPSLPSPSDREQARYESPAACGHPKRYLTSSSPGASDVICAICRLTELEREMAPLLELCQAKTITAAVQQLHEAFATKRQLADKLQEVIHKREAAESQVAVLRAALKDIYDFFMAPSACGDFTCYCGNPEVCGICEIRGQTEKLLALTPSPESTDEKKE